MVAENFLVSLRPACHFATSLPTSLVVQIVVSDGERVANSSVIRVKRSRMASTSEAQGSVAPIVEPATVSPVVGLIRGLSVGVSPQTISALNRWRQQMRSRVILPAEAESTVMTAARHSLRVQPKKCNLR